MHNSPLAIPLVGRLVGRLVGPLVGPLLLAKAVLFLLKQDESEEAASGDKPSLAVTVKLAL